MKEGTHPHATPEMFDSTNQQMAIQTIIDVAGREGWKALRAAKGGTEVWIPLAPGPDHWMVEVFGQENALEIIRRLTVIDAEGRTSCSIRLYVAQTNSRITEFKAELARQVTDGLLSGMTTREVALSVRISERTVWRQRAALIADGRLKALPSGQKPRIPPPRPPSSQQEAKQAAENAACEFKRALVDEALLKGHSNAWIASAASVGRTFIRMRRKLLFASGRLKPGRVVAAEARP